MSPYRPLSAAPLVALVLASLVALTVCLEGRTGAPPGQRCDGDEECPDQLVCQYGRCRALCAFDRDCEEGICVPPESGSGSWVCSLPDEGPCPCEEGICVAGVCLPDTDPIPPDGDADGDHDAGEDGDIDSEADGDAGGDAEDDAETDGDTGPPCFDIAAPAILAPGNSWHDPAHVFDLSAGPAILEATVDVSALGPPFPQTWVEVGLHQVGAADFNPGPVDVYQGGEGGWATLHVDNDVPSPGDQTIHDKVLLSASTGRGEGDYDVLEGPALQPAPIGNFVSLGIWFDRDGVDATQATHWGAVDGGTYNTAGRYQVRITYTLLEPGLGAMMATINGVATGFFIGGWRNEAPDYLPAGLAFRADLTRLQVFAGLAGGPTGTAALSVVRVCGWPAP